jgi:uncharacterized membrane protein YfcA
MEWLSLPAEVSPAALVALVAVGLVAGLARGFSAFGAALIFVPVASTVIGPRLAVPLLLAIDATAGLSMVAGAWRHADRREVATMAVGALVGVPAGALILSRLDPTALRWAIALFVSALFVLLASGWRFRGRQRPALTAGVGVVAGFLAGATQMTGPPVLAYWLGSAATPRVVRANLVMFFLVTSALTAMSFLLGGLIVPALLPLALAAWPGYGLGIFIGARMFHLASEATFRRICLGLIALAAVAGLPIFDGILR